MFSTGFVATFERVVVGLAIQNKNGKTYFLFKKKFR